MYNNTTSIFRNTKSRFGLMVKPEEKARHVIDGLLEAAGWRVQNLHDFNLGEAVGIAIREFSLSNGIADYLLFVNRKAVGVIEAKSEGTTLSGVAEQTAKYLLLKLICYARPNARLSHSNGV